jgi:RimJ/RimL family protein N-acetyltransferase
MTVLETDRLLLTRLSYDHCEFIVELVNEPSFKRFIGDKDVNSLQDARRYLAEGPIGLYERFGYGMFLVTVKDSDTPAGICGLLKREGFDDPDLGFAFLKRFRNLGFATESAQAVLKHGFEDLGLRRIIAMADPENEPSVSLLHKLGFEYERKARMPEDDHDINLYALET